MESLYSLVKSLSERELDIVKKSFRQLASEDSESKTMQLFDLLIVAKQCPSRLKMMNEIYGRENDATFRQLKSRLSGRILDMLISERNLDALEDLDPMNIIGVKLRKRVAQIFSLFSTKGNIPMLDELIETTLKQAAEYNVYPVLVEVLRFKKSLLFFSSEIDVINNLNSKINYYQECDQAKLIANEYYNRLIHKVDFKAYREKSTVQSELLTSIVELRVLYENLNAPSVGYFLRKLELEYYLISEEFDEAKLTCRKLLELLQKKELCRKERVGMVFDNLGQIELVTGNYIDAIRYFEKAQGYYKSNSVNILVSKEQQFITLFYQKKYDQCLFLLKQMKVQNSSDQGEFKTSKLDYYQCCLLFAEEKFNECYSLIRQTFEITQDKSGWGINLRILSIMTTVELGFLDQASSEIISFQRHIERTSRKESLSERSKFISKILMKIEREGFLWSSIHFQKTLDINRLSVNESDIGWNPLSGELIQFHNWLFRKLKSGNNGTEALASLNIQ